MKEKLSNKFSYIGAGTGLALFAIFGLMQGAYLGGILGLNMANTLFGIDVAPSVIHRILTAIGMLTGVMVAGLMFVVSGACLGWLVGLLIGSFIKAEAKPAKEIVTKESEK